MIKQMVHKYRLPIPSDDSPEVTVSMPRDAEVLHVAVQQGVACAWALVDPQQEKIDRVFEIYGTGWRIENDKFTDAITSLKHLGTFQLDDYRLVFHVFERKVIDT